MKVNVDLTRADLIWANLLLAYRVPANWSFVVFVGVGYFGMYLYRNGFAHGTGAVLRKLGEASLTALVTFVALSLTSIVFSVLSASVKAGVLGVHEYELEPDGLRERTEANDTLNKWSGMRKVIKTRRCILVCINWYLFHLIPRRCFESQEAYDSFYAQIEERRRNVA